MSVFERISTKRHRDEVDVSTRATCLRCRREYKREPDAREDEDYCWWCAARISNTRITVVIE